MINKVFKTGTYKINVGKGGNVSASSNGGDGFNSSITEVNNANKIYDNINLIGRGGGCGASGGNNGRNGGSGGGGAHNQTNGGISIQGNTRWSGTSYVAGGFNGGKPFFGSRGSGGGVSIEIEDNDELVQEVMVFMEYLDSVLGIILVY